MKLWMFLMEITIYLNFQVIRKCWIMNCFQKNNNLNGLRNAEGYSSPGVGGRGRQPFIRSGAPWPCPCRTAVLSSPYERGAAAPAADTPGRQNSRVLRCFVLFAFFPFFGSCGLRWVNMGQDRPQDGPT